MALLFTLYHNNIQAGICNSSLDRPAQGAGPRHFDAYL